MVQNITTLLIEMYENEEITVPRDLCQFTTQSWAARGGKIPAVPGQLLPDSVDEQSPAGAMVAAFFGERWQISFSSM